MYNTSYLTPRFRGFALTDLLGLLVAALLSLKAGLGFLLGPASPSSTYSPQKVLRRHQNFDSRQTTYLAFLSCCLALICDSGRAFELFENAVVAYGRSLACSRSLRIAAILAFCQRETLSVSPPDDDDEDGGGRGVANVRRYSRSKQSDESKVVSSDDLLMYDLPSSDRSKGIASTTAADTTA